MRASLIVIGVTFLFIGAIFVAIGGRPLIEERRYQQAARAEAIAIGKTLQRATATSDTAYEINYRFQLPDGRSHVRVERVPVHVWEPIDAGAPLTVEYLNGEPASARVVTERALRPAALWLLLGSALMVGGFIAIKRSFRRPPVETPSSSPPSYAVAAPEPSFWPLARRSNGFWFGAMFLAVGGMFFLGGGRELYQDVMFIRVARVTQGVVLTKEIKRTGRQNRTKRYEATYRYSVGGQTFEARDRVPFDGWTRLIERQPVGVHYRPDDPARGRLDGPRPWLAEAFMTLLGALFASIGATFFIRAIRHARLEWRLRQSGVAASGTIVELAELMLKVDGVVQWRLNYRYQDFRGQAHDKSITIPEDEAGQFKIGDVGKVMYDPARPAEALWFGRS